jgi:predicted DNA-binding transcriptional regulator YafY
MFSKPPTSRHPRLRTRPPLERMLRIHQAIQAGRFPNAAALARELEVSSKSIHRDLEFMRDRLELPVQFDARRNGYYYTEEVGSFPTVQITEGELFALLLAEKALQQYRGTTFEKPLLSAFRKISATLPDTVSFNLSDWGESISFRFSAEPVLDLRVFDELARATARRQQLLLAYRKPGREEAELRKVDPYHLANINGEWFLFAFCHLRQDIRTFAPARIASITRTGQSFCRPADFSLQDRLSLSFGVRSGEGEHDIRIIFSKQAAGYIREKIWHSSQRIVQMPDGRIELHLRLSSLEEIQRWVLGWGGHAVVLYPPELAAAVRSAAQLILESSHQLEP